MDRLILERIRVKSVIGVLKEERNAEQELMISLDLAGDFSAIEASDRLQDGVDYCEVVDHVRSFARQARGGTIEYFAARLADSLRQVFGFERVAVDVEKPRYAAALGLDSIRFHVER